MALAASAFGLSRPRFESPADAVAYSEWILSYADRPWDWVLVCYPWGEEGSPLEDRAPENWQRDLLQELQSQLLAARSEEQKQIAIATTYNRVIKIATATGHGTGKTAQVSWIVHWFISTHPNAQIIVTASTEKQLSTKTWRELRRWQVLAINGWMFEWTATSYKHIHAPELWFASAIPWSDHNSQAFAGAHEKYVLVLFDEASGIGPKIWEVVEGAMTTGLCLFLAFGNPTESSGGFHDCFHRFRHRWTTFRVDARTVTFANTKEINQWIEDYGEDSDFVRTRVRGEFPKQAATQFIGHDVVLEARKRTIDWRDIPRSVPRLMGVDVARYGDDDTVIILRQGRKMHPKIIVIKHRDLMYIASEVSRLMRDLQPDVVFIDGVGIGAGVVDRLIQLGYKDVIVEVQGGTKPSDPKEKQVYANMRAVMWARMRDWLMSADVPDDPDLEEDLCCPNYTYERRTQLQLIESKEDIKSRGMASPDRADALSLTFYELVPVKSGGGRSVEPDEV